jgi:signal peptidase
MKRIFALILAAAILTCCLIACDKKNRVQVLSNSMSPTYSAGDWVTYEPIDDCSVLKQGDIIVYEDKDGNSVVHRIVEIIKDESGSFRFVTKADANNIVDEDPVTEDQIIGRAVSK